MPVQYKYFFAEKKIELRRILALSKSGLGLPKNPVFLLVEGNHCFGVTALNATKDLKADFPGCKIIYAADAMDYAYQKNEYADQIFYGELTNETRALSGKECQEKGIANITNVFPWENVKEEWTTVQGKQFEYGDLGKVMENSETKVIIENE